MSGIQPGWNWDHIDGRPSGYPADRICRICQRMREPKTYQLASGKEREMFFCPVCDQPGEDVMSDG